MAFPRAGGRFLPRGRPFFAGPLCGYTTGGCCVIVYYYLVRDFSANTFQCCSRARGSVEGGMRSVSIGGPIIPTTTRTPTTRTGPTHGATGSTIGARGTPGARGATRGNHPPLSPRVCIRFTNGRCGVASLISHTGTSCHLARGINIRSYGVCIGPRRRTTCCIIGGINNGLPLWELHFYFSPREGEPRLFYRITIRF